MSSSPSLMQLFLNRFLPAALAFVISALFLYEIDERTHKNFLTQIGMRPDEKLLLQLHEHLLGSLVPVSLLLFIIMIAVCLLFASTRKQQLDSDIKLQEQLYKTQLLLDSTQEGIYGTDHEGRCTLANKACAELLGYDSPDDLLGQSMHDLMHHTRPDGSYYPAEECSAHKISETGVVGIVENELFWRKDGSSFPVSYSVLPMRDDLQTIGMVCSFVDITEKLQIEEQLRQAQKMEAVGQLSGGIAHDFNNILQIVSNNSQLIMKEFDKTNPLYGSLEEMVSAVGRGSNLTRSMLAFSRKQFMRIRPAELNQVLLESLPLGEKLLPRGIHLDFLPCGEPLPIAADTTLLQQVLFNLLSNARDAMPDGGIITISTCMVQPDAEQLALNCCSHQGMYACLSVTDEGCGIPEEIRNNIFDPFFTTKEVGKGTGLGLSMVFGTIKQHGGFITVASSPGSGSAFSVYVPIQST